jgi:hypothetical protein
MMVVMEVVVLVVILLVVVAEALFVTDTVCVVPIYIDSDAFVTPQAVRLIFLVLA